MRRRKNAVQTRPRHRFQTQFAFIMIKSNRLQIVMLAHLDGIPPLRMRTKNDLFYLEKIYRIVIKLYTYVPKWVKCAQILAISYNRLQLIF